MEVAIKAAVVGAIIGFMGGFVPMIKYSKENSFTNEFIKNK